MSSMSKLAAAGDGPGWADLPRDLLESILARLPVPDRLRFPAVCTSWQSAAAFGSNAPLSPWLMLPFNPAARGGAAVAARFLSLAEGRAYAIRQPAPAASGRVCVGTSPDGWLVTTDAFSELHLLNPVTGAQVQLPSVATLPFVDATRGADGRVESYNFRCFFPADDCDGEVLIPPATLAPDRLRYEVYDKAIVVSAPRRLASPSGETWGGYAVLLICQPLSRVAVARAGDAGWTLLDTPARCWVDAVRAAGADGAVYAMDTAGRVEAWDMDATTTNATPTPSRAIAPPCRCSARACAMLAACRRYLVELESGHLLHVHRLRGAAHAGYTWEPRPEYVEYTTTGVDSFEWKAGDDEACDLPQWSEVDGEAASRVLGARAVFLGKSASLCVPVDCSGSGGELRGNRVYFTDGSYRARRGTCSG
uniref:F-box domain-containing protein n=1 Tax=Setaria italica TaxID=4555 RepID=K3Y3H7_SETIT